MTEVNFQQLMNEAASAGFSTVPAGTYNAAITKCEAVPTKTGKPMLKTQFKIFGGPQDGRLVFTQFVLSADNANALGFFFRHMAALGLPSEYFAQNPPMDAVAAALLNRQATIDVVIKPYQGVDKNEISAIKPLQGAPAQAAAPVQAAVPVASVAPAPAPVPVAPPVASPPVAPAPVAPPAHPVPAPPVPVPAAPVVPPPPPAPNF